MEPLTDLPLIAKVRSQSSGEIDRGKRKEYIIKALIRQVERRDKRDKRTGRSIVLDKLVVNV